MHFLQKQSHYFSNDPRIYVSLYTIHDNDNFVLTSHNPNLDLEYFVLLAEFINLYYIDELIPSSKKFCLIYSPHQ